GDCYRLGAVHIIGNTVLTQREVFEAFDDCCFRWGRFNVARMRDKARELEKKLHERGYPAARVLPEFDLARDADPKQRKVNLRVKIVEKRRVEVKYLGNRSIGDKD